MTLLGISGGRLWRKGGLRPCFGQSLMERIHALPLPAMVLKEHMHFGGELVEVVLGPLRDTIGHPVEEPEL